MKTEKTQNHKNNEESNWNAKHFEWYFTSKRTIEKVWRQFGHQKYAL